MVREFYTCGASSLILYGKGVLHLWGPHLFYCAGREFYNCRTPSLLLYGEFYICRAPFLYSMVRELCTCGTHLLYCMGREFCACGVPSLVLHGKRLLHLLGPVSCSAREGSSTHVKPHSCTIQGGDSALVGLLYCVGRKFYTC